ncbi:MAG: hypothetical protein R3E10_07950 [Gemmatimonadota bacterium]
MSSDLQSAHDDRFQEALEASGARDPREFYRERLRELKQSDPAAYQQAVSYYQDELVPKIARGEVEPLSAWLEYGRRLCAWTAPGETVEVDASGQRHPHRPPTPSDRLVLHLPDDKGTRALLVGLPQELSAAQRATFDLLVQGRLKLRQ